MPLRKSAYGSVALVGALIVFSPANANTITLTCNLTPSARADLLLEDGPDIAAPTMHVIIDTSARTVTDWATIPDDPNPGSGTLHADLSITKNLMTWSTKPEPGSKKATRYFDRETNVLNTVDPGGGSTLWNCV